MFDLPSPMNVPIGAFMDNDELSERKGELRIAWRYGNSTSTNQMTDRSGPIFGHTFDLSTHRRIVHLVSSNEINYWIDDFSEGDRKSHAHEIREIMLYEVCDVK